MLVLTPARVHSVASPRLWIKCPEEPCNENKDEDKANSHEG